MTRLTGSIFLVFIIFAVSCKNDEPSKCTKEVSGEKISSVDQTQLELDIAAIDTYLTNGGVTGVIEDPTGIRYVIHENGTGKLPCLESTIDFTFSGHLLSDGSFFGEALYPISYRLTDLILGWQVALLKFPEGTRATLYIPSGFGYGPTDRDLIPANSNLIFQIELVSF
jgi:FKBP-type peptidyl-prolyl cis-trans isomerase FkpA